MRFRLILTLLLVVFWGASAESINGRKILEQSIHRPGYKDAHLKIKLTKTRAGLSREIVLELYQRRYPEMVATLVVIDEPESARGISFLTWDYLDPEKPDKKWYYLPAINQYKELNDEQGRKYEEKFGFSTEIFAINLDEAEHQLLGEEEVGGKRCYKVESVLKNPDHPRGARIITWVEKDTWVARKVQAFDKKGRLIREFLLLEEKKFDGFWQEMAGRYQDYQENRTVEFKVLEAKFNQGLKDELFLSTRLKPRAEKVKKGSE